MERLTHGKEGERVLVCQLFSDKQYFNHTLRSDCIGLPDIILKLLKTIESSGGSAESKENVPMGTIE